VNTEPIFTALADPTRRDLLLNLAQNSPKTASQFATEYPITRQGILKHLDVLEAAGLVAAYRHGREKRYTLTPKPLNDLEQWIHALSAKWDERLGRLKHYVETDMPDPDGA
jgi:DNA-binding transcriptional ArsR family regulator